MRKGLGGCGYGLRTVSVLTPLLTPTGGRLAGRKGREETLGSVWTEGTCRRSIRTMASNGSCNLSTQTHTASVNERAGAVCGVGVGSHRFSSCVLYCRSYNRAAIPQPPPGLLPWQPASEVDGGSSSAADIAANKRGRMAGKALSLLPSRSRNNQPWCRNNAIDAQHHTMAHVTLSWKIPPMQPSHPWSS